MKDTLVMKVVSRHLSPFLTLKLFIALVLLPALGHAQAAEYETIPTPPDEQIAIFKELAAKNSYSCYDTDEEGNITFLGLCGSRFGRSQFPSSQVVDNREIEAEGKLPGIGNEDFREILHFPKLRELAAQSLNVTSEGFAVLRAFPELQVLNLSNAGSADIELLRHIAGMRDLKVLDLTHSFGGDHQNAEVLGDLQGFPELRVLIIDKVLTNDFENLLPFLQRCPKIAWLKLHRCPFGDEQMRQVFDALPDLRRLDMKPRGNTPGKNWSHQSLAMLKDYPNLHYLRLIHGDALPLPWENGLEHLVDATNITAIEFPLKGKNAVREEDIKRLMEARPDLNILRLPENLKPKDHDRWEMREEMRSYEGLPEEVQTIIEQRRWVVGPG